MSKNVERFTAGSQGVLWGYGQGEWVRHSDYEQLQSRLAQVEQELAEEKRLRTELKQIAQEEIAREIVLYMNQKSGHAEGDEWFSESDVKTVAAIICKERSK